MIEERGQGGGGADDDDAVYMPLKTVQRRFKGDDKLDYFVLKYDAGYAPSAIQDALVGLLRERRLLQDAEPNDFNVIDTAQVNQALGAVTGALTAMVAVIASISLLVGGIGIMNIMLVSVTERTREIGIRLAIGALAREVRLQFLTEAVVFVRAGRAGRHRPCVRRLGRIGSGDRCAFRVRSDDQHRQFCFRGGQWGSSSAITPQAAPRSSIRSTPCDTSDRPAPTVSLRFGPDICRPAETDLRADCARQHRATTAASPCNSRCRTAAAQHHGRNTPARCTHGNPAALNTFLCFPAGTPKFAGCMGKALDSPVRLRSCRMQALPSLIVS